MRFSLTALYGSDFEGGHLAREGNTPDGESVTVPLYRHEVSLDYARVELALQYALAPGWDLTARVPWEQKVQRAGIAEVDPATAEDRAAMQRNIDLHHRSVTLRGIGDLMFLGRRRWFGTWREDDALTLSAGATVPTGSTVDDPYDLGDRGLRHLHIQFGTGTVDPLLEAGYSAPVRGRFSAGAYLASRLPFYENRRGFQAPPDGTVGIHLAHRTSDRLQLRVEGAFFAQGRGYWNGARDENTGLLATSLTAGATWHLGAASLSADVRYPLSQRTLTEGDAFTQGPTVVVSVGGLLRR